jgi:hypothetical protein
VSCLRNAITRAAGSTGHFGDERTLESLGFSCGFVLQIPWSVCRELGRYLRDTTRASGENSQGPDRDKRPVP